MASDGVLRPVKPGRDLGVEEVGRHGAALELEDLEVLVGGVQHGDLRAPQDLGERRHVDRQRIDEHELARPGQLHQGELREVGALPVELGVERVGVDRAEGRDDVAEPGVGVDDPEGG